MYATNEKEATANVLINQIPPTVLAPAWSTSEKRTLLRLIQALVRESLIPFSLKNKQLTFYVASGDINLYISNVNFTSLYRCLDFDDIYFMQKGEVKKVVSLVGFLNYLYCFVAHLANDKLWERLLSELYDHEKNSLMAENESARKAQDMKISTSETGNVDVLSWVKANKTIADESLFMEQFVSQGHPIHPCSKTKYGFSMQDTLAYSPEFGPTVNISVAAIHKNISGLSLSKSIEQQRYCPWFASVFPDEYNAWEDALKSLGLDVSEYLPIPVHPWQEKEIIHAKFQAHINKQWLCFFDGVHIKASPTLSFRTLKPVGNVNAPYIKLPVAIQATSVFRTLSPCSVKNASIASDVLHDIFVTENNFDNCLDMLPEVAGVYLEDGSGDGASHLGVIFRESANNKTALDESCVVVASLFEASPFTNKPVLIEQMMMAGVINVNGAKAYFNKYATQVINSYLTLYLRYGVALEGHQQNTLAVFKSGEIQRFVARDFDGIDIDANVFNDIDSEAVQSLTKVMASDSAIPRNNLLHTVYQSHLGEVIILLTQYFDCEEEVLWHQVAEVTHACFMKLKDTVTSSRWKMEYQAIMKQDWICRALLRMRLTEQYHRDGLFVNLNNPLAKFMRTDNINVD
tara:strand:- start:3650 stop:5542 length:1893 start_codon:yes stop_codon:yes gene_type:complete